MVDGRLNARWMVRRGMDGWMAGGRGDGQKGEWMCAWIKNGG